ncbi:hypothetical protein G6N05_05715 [Flavobacterium sp. F372]|jgi:hypothetical protein|uniref:Uncharacterized protein n=1 Tax=Flavobacterium bernardetii TaxID=2813823 RepID=A0ABR7J2D4_9FLAO|nr:hypothetical protein [Flavobacterium bernardetii]MBC5835877.1 hypothetical protein [Flavobacterium bernardetii]NHF69607.1 hypothetical protein [Flavobacterium bernardetii]
MSTTNTTGPIVTPPGVEITSDFKSLNSTIQFTKPRPTEPLPPLVQAYYENGNLEVSTVAFIDASQKIDLISVFYDDSLKTPTFYITYTAPETKASEFMGYQVNFTIELANKPEVIETFVWDEDPINSRGTTTTVQP